MIFRIRLRTYWALGLFNVARVGLYRLRLRLGRHPIQWVQATQVQGPFFRMPVCPAPAGTTPREAWKTEPEYFGRTAPGSAFPPDWYANPFTTSSFADSQSDWWKIADFDPTFGDIKTVWEASRFDWVIAMAQRAACGETGEIKRLNAWLSDWVEAMPPYRGANWKCGQEASIRVIHLALAALILDQVSDSLPGLRDLIRQHLVRIAPTLDYAIAQQNNHGTSEAAALYIGGSWLAALGDRHGRAWQERGRKQLAERALALIEEDGTFSQYSTIYHRVMLDTYSFAEIWRQHHALLPFPEKVRERLGQAADWLHQLTDPTSGDAPNMGANDGARLIPLTDTDYRDFRPSVQLAQALFQGRLAYVERGTWDQPLVWLRVARPDAVTPDIASTTFDKGGLHILRAGAARAYLRYPRYRFRPVQADALHLDLWVGAKNLLRDGGTYSYNISSEDVTYFNGTEGHNTVQMDDRDQMFRLGRFLFGDWLKAHDVEILREVNGMVTAAAGYRDGWGATHHRHLLLTVGKLICTDRIKDFEERAVLRYRLYPSNWRLEGDTISDDLHSIRITRQDGVACPIALTIGYESRYYLLKSPVPVLESIITHPGTVVTEIRFSECA